MFRKYAEGEEGVDYIRSIGEINDPSMPDSKLLER
jgi:hypothetical protein